MARFQIQGPDGGIYEVDAPNEQAALSAIGAVRPKSLDEIGAVAGPAPDNTPINPGDWKGLSQRLYNAETQAVGPMRPEDRQAVRQMEARRQGELYGAAEGGGRNVQAAINSFANTAGLGLPQLMEAYIGQNAVPGADAHEFIKAADAARYDKNRVGATTGAVGGAVAQGFLLPGASTAGWRVANASGAGAGLSAVESAIRTRGDVNQVIDDTLGGAATGLLGGVAGEAVGKTIGGVTRFAKNSSILRNAPSRDELEAAKKAAYGIAEGENLTFTQPALQQLASQARTNLGKVGGSEIIAPQANKVLGLLDDAARSPQGLQSIEDIRRVAGQTGNKVTAIPDYAGGRNIVGSIDDFYNRLNPNQVIAGDAQKAIDALKQARLAAAAGKRSDAVTEAITKGERNAAATGSGANTDNAIRTQFRAILNNPNKTRGFSEAELAQMERTAAGGSLQNILRMLGKFDATGVVSTGVGGTALYGAGKAVGLDDKEALALAGTGILGAKGARYGAEAMTKRNAEVLDAMIRSRGIGQAVPDPAKLPDAVAQLRKLIGATSAASYPAYAGAK